MSKPIVCLSIAKLLELGAHGGFICLSGLRCGRFSSSLKSRTLTLQPHAAVPRALSVRKRCSLSSRAWAGRGSKGLCNQEGCSRPFELPSGNATASEERGAIGTSACPGRTIDRGSPGHALGLNLRCGPPPFLVRG